MAAGLVRLISGIPMVGTNKSLGQHWLKNHEILEEIADEIGDGELCIEIGPGLGTLTSSLLRRFKKVVAIEYDKRLADNLPKSFPGKNLEVINEDILKYNFNDIRQPYVVAGNIPYYITSPIIEKLIMLNNRPKKIVLLIQKEVADRICSDKNTLLSLMVRNRARVHSGLLVSKREFTPSPKVDSRTIILEPKDPEISDEIFDFVKRGFRFPRKKLIHNLANIKPINELKKNLRDLGINENVRPGDISLLDWKKLYQKTINQNINKKT